MIKTAGLHSLQGAINHYIALDTEGKSKLKRLAGKVMGLEVKGVVGKMFFVFTEDEVIIQSECNQEPDVMITCPPFSLARLFIKGDPEVFHSKNVKLEGDATFAQKVQSFFGDIDIDWEAYLATIMGDVVALQAGTFVRNTLQRTKSFSERLAFTVEEYVKEELRVVPCKEEAEDFFEEIADLRNAISRLEAKVKKSTATKGKQNEASK